MAGTTPELGLATAQDSDDLEVYLTANPGGLVAVLLILDALFSATTGHAHDAAHKGKPITSVGTLTSPHMTGPVVDSGGLTVTAGGISLVAGNMTLTTGQYIGNGGARFRAKDLGTIANAGTAAVDDVAGSLGLLVVTYGGGAVAGFLLGGGTHVTTLLFGPAATFTPTFNNAGTVNVYWNTTDYFLQNNTGGSNGFQTFLFATS